MKHSEKKQEPSLTKNFIVYFVRTVVSVLVPIITFPYASRILGPSGIGRVQYAQSGKEHAVETIRKNWGSYVPKYLELIA